MPGFDPSVISSIADGQADPTAAQGKAYTLAGMKDSQQMNHLQLQDAQQQMKDKAATRQIMASSNTDLTNAKSVAETAERLNKGGQSDAAMKLLKTSQDFQSGAIDQEIKKLELADKQYGAVGAALDIPVRQLDAMKEAGMKDADIQAAAPGIITKAAKQLELDQPLLKPGIDKWLANPQNLTLDGAKSFLSQSTQGRLMNQQRINEHKQTIADQQQRNKDAAQTDNDRRTRVAEERQATNEKRELDMKEKEQKKQDDKEAGIIAPDDMNFIADRVISGDKSAITGISRGKGGDINVANLNKAVRIRATEAAKAQGLTQEEAPRWVAARMAEYQGDVAAERRRGTIETNIAAPAQEFSNMLPILEKASANLPRSNWKSVNWGNQWWESEQSDPRLAALSAAIQSQVNIYARAINPTGVSTVDAKQHARALLSTIDGPEALKSTIGILKQEVEQARLAPDQVKDQIMQTLLGHKRESSIKSDSKTSDKSDDKPKKSYKSLFGLGD